MVRVPDGSAAASSARSMSKKLNFSGKQKYSVSRRYAVCERAGKSISASSSPKPAGRIGIAARGTQRPLPSASAYAHTPRMNSASRSAAQNDGSPSMNTRRLASFRPAIVTCAPVAPSVIDRPDVACGGGRTASGALRIGSKRARDRASGATVTG